MKLITLNTWGGRVHEALADFFAKHQDIDIFCFQEVFQAPQTAAARTHSLQVESYKHDADLFETLKTYLPLHEGYFCPVLYETYGICVFLKKGIEVLRHGEMVIAEGDWDHTKQWTGENDHDRKMQWLELKAGEKTFFLINVHLTHRPEGKSDTPKRLEQSRRIIEFIASHSGSYILVGDFNLKPDTDSIGAFEKAGMRNLVKEYKVESTRTKLYRRFENGPKFADYIFTSPDIKVNDFKVLLDIVSDHSPLVVEFE